jgi:hypothetical protein
MQNTTKFESLPPLGRQQIACAGKSALVPRQASKVACHPQFERSSIVTTRHRQRLNERRPHFALGIRLAALGEQRAGLESVQLSFEKALARSLHRRDCLSDHIAERLEATALYQRLADNDAQHGDAHLRPGATIFCRFPLHVLDRVRLRVEYTSTNVPYDERWTLPLSEGVSLR